MQYPCPRRGCLQYADRHSHNGGSGSHARTGGGRQPHEARIPPIDTADWSPGPNPFPDRLRQPIDHTVVAVDHSSEPPLSLILCWRTCVAQADSADALDIRGVKAFDELTRQTPVPGGCPSPGLSPDEVSEAQVNVASVG